MIVEFTKDSNERYCAVCHKAIAKGKLIVKYEEVLDRWKNTRMFFAHLPCLIKRLQKAQKDMEGELQIIPKTKIIIERHGA